MAACTVCSLATKTNITGMHVQHRLVVLFAQQALENDMGGGCVHNCGVVLAAEEGWVGPRPQPKLTCAVVTIRVLHGLPGLQFAGTLSCHCAASCASSTLTQVCQVGLFGWS